MLKHLSRLWDTAVRVEETQSVLLWLLSPFGGVVAMMSAYANGLPLYQILFWGTGVSAFLIHGLFQSWQWRQRTTAFEKLVLKDATISDVQMVSPDSPQFDIALQCQFFNTADVPLYFSLSRVTISIEGRINPQSSRDTQEYVLQPHDDMILSSSIVRNIDKKELLSGDASFTIAYGKSRDKLRYVLDHDVVFALTIVMPNPDAPSALMHSDDSV